ncbi:hypothetical protein [Shumkonia mesophila]|uniref:hypothetical protein n=1 Tax=Shumkonia mesophila TaxID=2838854 RepID=UPI0029344121|nr:hypothetical protein [Shumkonia mesophila]
MFILKTEHTFSWPVRAAVPVDGGQFAEATFDCTFKALPQARLEALVKGEISETEFLREAAVGPWTGVESPAGGDLPFSEAARDQVIAIPYMRLAMIRAYREAMSGEAVRKN